MGETVLRGERIQTQAHNQFNASQSSARTLEVKSVQFFHSRALRGEPFLAIQNISLLGIDSPPHPSQKLSSYLVQLSLFRSQDVLQKIPLFSHLKLPSSPLSDINVLKLA